MLFLNVATLFTVWGRAPSPYSLTGQRLLERELADPAPDTRSTRAHVCRRAYIYKYILLRRAEPRCALAQRGKSLNNKQHCKKSKECSTKDVSTSLKREDDR